MKIIITPGLNAFAGESESTQKVEKCLQSARGILTLILLCLQIDSSSLLAFSIAVLIGFPGH